MAGFKDANFADRQKEAARAKQALLEKFRAKPAADDPAVLARQAERKAVAEARAARTAERKARREAEAAAAAAAAEAERIAEAERLAAEEKRQAEEHEALLAAQKAARDARYAARKARR